MGRFSPKVIDTAGFCCETFRCTSADVCLQDARGPVRLLLEPDHGNLIATKVPNAVSGGQGADSCLGGRTDTIHTNCQRIVREGVAWGGLLGVASIGIMSDRSVKDALDGFGGVGPGFNTWRFGLATLIVFLHSFFVCYGRHAPISESVGRMGAPIFVAILPIFFGLSGFLVAGSGVRAKSVFAFLSFRAFRLVPALAVETTLAALLLGPALTDFHLVNYFTDKQFFAYFGNVVGRVRYELPGMFLSNPESGIVNLNLWTLHAELECYALMAIAIAVGLLRRRIVALSMWIVCTAALVWLNFTQGTWESSSGSLYQPPIFVYSFCTCVIAYLWADRIPHRKSVFVICCAAFVGIVYIHHTVFLAIPLLAYIMIYVGLSRTAEIKILSHGDYSYGIYLYSFIIQQTIALVPGLRHWWIVFPAAMAITLAIAATSWHTIEKPALAMKRFVFAKKPRSTAVVLAATS